MQFHRLLPRAVAFTLVCVAIALGGFLALERNMTVDQPPVRSEAIVILGCAVAEDGQPSPLLRSRVERGVQLWKEQFAPRIIVTGAAVANRWVEADVMAEYAQTLGVPAEAIVREPLARSTQENAVRVSEVMRANGWNTALVVTSPFHTRRSQRLFAATGHQVVVVSAPYPASLAFRERVMRLMYEVFRR